MLHYQVGVLGQIDWRFDAFKSALNDACSDLGIEPHSVGLIAEADLLARDPRLPTVAVFFGYDGASKTDHPTLNNLIANSTTIVPVVSKLHNVLAEVPAALSSINALALNEEHPSPERLVTLVLEIFRLLRRERRTFISYKRSDSQSLADKLYDQLDSRGFDVFLDTRSVPPAVDFQGELWHRLADCDVIVLIDTPNFRASRWTTEELAKANATNIQILHLLWPGQPQDADSAFSDFFELAEDDFVGGANLGGVSTIKPNVIEAICDTAEHLRARAMAFRYRYLVDSFCDLARDAGLAPVVQPQRWVLLELPNGKQLAVVPAIGVPSAHRIHEVFDAIRRTLPSTCQIWILYDNRGLLSSWLNHLDWLDMHLPVRNVRASSAADRLAEVMSC